MTTTLAVIGSNTAAPDGKVAMGFLTKEIAFEVDQRAVDALRPRQPPQKHLLRQPLLEAFTRQPSMNARRSFILPRMHKPWLAGRAVSYIVRYMVPIIHRRALPRFAACEQGGSQCSGK